MSGSPAEGFRTHFVQDQKSLDLGICGFVGWLQVLMVIKEIHPAQHKVSPVPLGCGSELRNSLRTCLAPKHLQFGGHFQRAGLSVTVLGLQFLLFLPAQLEELDPLYFFQTRSTILR